MRLEILSLRLVAATVAAALLSAAAMTFPAAARRQGAVAQEEAPVVVRFSAVDGEGLPVADLKAEDLRVTLEGAEQNIVSLARAADEPLRVVVMLDASASQERVLPAAKRLAAEMVAALLRPGRDEAAVVSFTGDATLVQDFTGDPGALSRAFAAVEFVPPKGYVSGGVLVLRHPPPKDLVRAGSTAIWDSLVHVCDNVFARARDGRRVVVLFTDGVDTSSRTTSDRAVERLMREGVAVYGVGFADKQSFDPVDRGALRKVSGRTGGRALFPKKEKDLADAFGQVGRGLLSSYAVTFRPRASKGGARLNKLRVELVNPSLRARGVEVAHPQGVFLGAPAAARR